ncbi:MAG: glycosyltransferase family 2 protein [Candidatus Paceibacterota bacterium]
MSLDLTALIAVKDREFNINYCLSSIDKCNPKPKCILVDFGSKIPLSGRFNYDWLQVIRVTRNTSLFHKARALNIGLKKTTTKYVCATDADQVFNPSFFGVVHDLLMKNPKAFVMCYTYFLYKAPNFKPHELNYHALLKQVRASKSKLSGDGCCNGINKDFLMSVHGWDERYIGYGAEDSDMNLRARLRGYNIVWAHKYTNMIHLPHSRSTPYHSASYLSANRKMYYTRRRIKDVVVNPRNWGEI